MPSCESSATSYYPYYLLFRRHQDSPQMFYCLPSQSNHTESYPEYDNKWEDQMRQAFQIAKNHSEARKENDIARKVI